MNVRPYFREFLMSESNKASNIVEEIVSRHVKKSLYKVLAVVLLSAFTSSCFLWISLSDKPRSTMVVEQDQGAKEGKNEPEMQFDTKQKLIGYINAVMSKPISDDEVAMDFAFGLLHHRPAEAWGLANDKRIELDIQDLQDAQTLLNAFNHYTVMLDVAPAQAHWAEEYVLAELSKDVSQSKDKLAVLTQVSSFIDLWTTYYQATPATDEQRDAKNLYAQRAKEKILSRLDSNRM